MQPAKLNYKIYQGSTFEEAYRWESETKVYVPIASITKAAPCEITTTTPHNLPIGWRFKVVGAGGMKEINSVSDSTEIATFTANTLIRVNQVNSLGYTTYTSGGVVEFNQPVPLAGYSARMQIRESVDSPTVIYEASSSAGQIVLNNNLGTITITIPASATTLFTFTTAVYAVELFDSNGKVIPFLVGNLTLVPEVTR
jgi:hypothetical protein